MKKKWGWMRWGVFCSALVSMAACSGGGSSESSGGSVTEIDSLSDVPTAVLDPSQYDHTMNAQASIARPLSTEKSALKGQAVGSFSRAGCEMDRLKRNIIRNAKMPQMLLCYMTAFEEAMGVNAAGDGSYNYWKGDRAVADNVGEGPQGIEEFLPRMAIKKSGGVLTFVMCNGDTQAMELVISTEGGRYDGHVIGQFGMHNNKLEFNADGTPEAFTTASFGQTFIERQGSIVRFGTAALDATPTSNVVSGSHHEEGEKMFAGGVYSKFDRDKGTAKFRTDAGSYPAPTVQKMFSECEARNGECGDLNTEWLGAEGWMERECALVGVTANTLFCFSRCVEGQPCCPTAADGDECQVEIGEGHVESFAINSTDPYNLLFTVVPTSAFEADVRAASIPESGVEPSIEFTVADVDCSSSASWTEMAFASAPEVSDCIALEQEKSRFDPGDLCQEQEGVAAGGAH